MRDPKPPAFTESVQFLQDNFGMDYYTARESVDNRLSSFKDRNQKLLEKQNDSSNSAQIQLISHFALLATLTLTVTGFIITQTEQTVTNSQHWLIIIILCFEIASIGFGAYDYIQTITFHDKWAKKYYNVDVEINRKIKNGTLQRIS